MPLFPPLTFYELVWGALPLRCLRRTGYSNVIGVCT